MLASTIGFTSMHTMIRHVSFEMHPFEIVFFRSLFGTLVLVPAFLRHSLEPLRTQKFSLHVARGLLNVVAIITFFYGLSLTALAEVTALNFSAPLFTTLAAVLVLGERIRARRVIALLVGFSGMLVILRPGFAMVGAGPMIIIFSAATWAATLTLTKTILRTDSAITVVSYMTLFLVPISFLLALFYWQWPSLEQLLWLLLIGVLGGAAQICLNQAYKEAEATAITPLDFSRLIWASVLGYIAFGEIPDVWIYAGGVLIFSSVVYITYREARARADHPAEPSARSGGQPTPPL